MAPHSFMNLLSYQYASTNGPAIGDFDGPVQLQRRQLSPSSGPTPRLEALDTGRRPALTGIFLPISGLLFLSKIDFGSIMA
jgi:hypothetical protein